MNNRNLGDRAVSIMAPIDDGDACGEETAQQICEILSCRDLVDLEAFGDLVLQIDIARFQFSQEQLDDFSNILLANYPLIKRVENRILILSLILHTNSAEVAIEALLNLLSRQQAAGLPMGELYWELHHFVRRQEGTEQLRERIGKELEAKRVKGG